VRRGLVAVWVGEKVKTSTSPSQKARRQARGTARRTGESSHRQMDITWLTDRIAVGGGIWNADNMAAVAREGITHIIDMQLEFDDTPLAVEQGIQVLWNPTDDDFEAKPAALFQRGVDFAQEALHRDEAKLFIHCAAGVHRAPMMALALLCADGWNLEDARDLIESRRPVADFAEIYVESVEKYLEASAKRTDPWSV
jgi:protein-tyrosine phosphatase